MNILTHSPLSPLFIHTLASTPLPPRPFTIILYIISFLYSTYQRRQAEARADKRSLAMKKWGTNTTEGGKSKQMSLEEISMLKALHGYHANLINPFNNHTDYTYR